MLQIFRDKSQSTFIQAIVLVIALVFIFWGVGANMMDSREAALVVNNDEISFQTYQRLYDKLLSGYRQQFGGSIPDGLLKSLRLSDQVKNQLIQEALLRQGAAEMGLLVSAPEIQKHIQEMMQFQENDSFNLEKYKAILASNRLTPHKFEISQGVDMLSSKGIKAISNFATIVTDAEINDIYQQAKESIRLNFVKISPSDFLDRVEVDEEALALWFEKNKEKYKTAPEVKLRFLSFPYSPQPATASPEASPNKAAIFQQANNAYEGIISAGSLQEYASKNPQAAVLETDFFAQGTAPPNLDGSPLVQETAFSLKAGELSSLIESPSGYTILFAEAIQEPMVPELSAVHDRVSEDYRIEQSRYLARKKAAEMLTALQSGTAFSKLAKTEGLNTREASLSRTSSGADSNGFPPSLLGDIFSLSSKNPLPKEAAKVGEDFFLYQFLQRTLPDRDSLTPEDMAKYKEQLLSAKRERILISWIRHQEKSADIFTNKTIK